MKMLSIAINSLTVNISSSKKLNIYDGPCVVKFIAAILPFYQYFLAKNVCSKKYLSITFFGQVKNLGRKKIDEKNC